MFRYDLDYVTDLGGAPQRILPTPLSQVWETDRVVNIVDGGWVVVLPTDSTLTSEGQYLAGNRL